MKASTSASPSSPSSPSSASSKGALSAARPPADRLSSAELERLRTVLGRDPGPVRIEDLTHGQWSSSVQRLSGTDWSVVRKTWPLGGEPSAVGFGERESHVLAGPLLDGYRAAGLHPPEALGAYVEGGVLTVFLADAGAEHVRDVAELADASRRLGRAQGTYVAAVPGHTWLALDFLGDHATRRADTDQIADVFVDDAAWAEPSVADTLGPLRRRLTRLWQQRTELLAVLRTMPVTLLHNDVWPANLLRARRGFVLLDWGFCGPGAIGSDVANLVADSVFDGYQPVKRLRELEQACAPAYLSGLRDAGVDVSTHDFRRAYAAAGAVKYCWLGPRSVLRVAHGELVTDHGRPADPRQVLDVRARGLRHVLGWLDEALGG